MVVALIAGALFALVLLAAGALLAIGLNELVKKEDEGGVPSWAGKLDRLCAMPLPPLLASKALESRYTGAVEGGGGGRE